MEYRMAVIGYGGMGSWHHQNVEEKVSRVRVTGAYDVREEARETAAQRGLHSYPTLEALLEDSAVELVTVATPNNFHKELVVRCLSAGKNVICEKPVAMNAQELEEMIAAARETGKLFTVHQNRRWDRDYGIVRKILEDKTIGKPYFIESRVQGSRGSMHGWRGYKVNGGGMLYDWGVHLIDQMLDLIPAPVTEVEAHLLSVFSDEVDDNIKVMLRFENGVSALCEMSTNCFINLPRWHVSCDDGTAVIRSFSCDGEMVKLKESREMEWTDDIVYTEAGPTRTMAPRPAHTTEQLALPEVVTDWTEFYHNVADVLDGRAQLIVRPEQALRVMRVIDLAFQSEREKTGIRCHI